MPNVLLRSRRTSVLRAALILLLFVSGSYLCGAQEPEPDKPIVMSKPKLPFVQKDVCPFECCTYRHWTATKRALLYQSWKRSGRKVIGSVRKGERVLAATGVVVTYRPSRFRARQNVNDLDLKIGDEFPAYAYRGEGVFDFWNKGKFYQGEIYGQNHCAKGDPDFQSPTCVVEDGEFEWWAQVTTQAGRKGWVWMDKARFDNVDACS